MNVENEIRVVQNKIQHLSKRLRWIRKNRVKLEALPESGVIFDDKLDFDRLSHQQIVKVIRTFGGKWQKKPTHGQPNKIDYETKVDGLSVRCWAGEPPPSCRLVEVEEVIPAHTVPEQRIKKLKLVCAPELAGQIAVLRSKPGETP